MREHPEVHHKHDGPSKGPTLPQVRMQVRQSVVGFFRQCISGVTSLRFGLFLPFYAHPEFLSRVNSPIRNDGYERQTLIKEILCSLQCFLSRVLRDLQDSFRSTRFGLNYEHRPLPLIGHIAPSGFRQRSVVEPLQFCHQVADSESPTREKALHFPESFGGGFVDCPLAFSASALFASWWPTAHPAAAPSFP
jgi:hypothetical protein